MLNMNLRRNTSPSEALMQKIRQVDFALYDTILYLDAYPNCRKALSHYHTLLEMHRKLTAEYESEYGPITAFGNESKTSYDWTASPWPWEMT